MNSAQDWPLVSFVVIAYKQEQYVRAACEAALAQDYPNLEIIFSDDRSPDKTFDAMQEVATSYKGSHRLVLNQNETNLGLIDHVNHLHTLTKGVLTVVAAGDDVSAPQRTTEIVRTYLDSSPKPYLIHSSVMKIDAEDKELGLWRPPLIEKSHTLTSAISSLSLVIGATQAWTRDLFDRFGPIKYKDAYEDLVLAVRGMLLGGVAYIDKPLVRYRASGGISTSYWSPEHSTEHVAQSQIRLAKMAIAVFQQRADDCKKMGRTEFMPALQRPLQLASYQLALTNQPHWKVFTAALRNNNVLMFIKLYRKFLSNKLRRAAQKLRRNYSLKGRG